MITIGLGVLTNTMLITSQIKIHIIITFALLNREDILPTAFGFANIYTFLRVIYYVTGK